MVRGLIHLLRRQVRRQQRTYDLAFRSAEELRESRVGLDDLHVQADADHPEGRVQDDVVQRRCVAAALDQQGQRFAVRIDLADHHQDCQGPDEKGQENVQWVA